MLIAEDYDSLKRPPTRRSLWGCHIALKGIATGKTDVGRNEATPPTRRER
jgi:hypothetical protein